MPIYEYKCKDCGCDFELYLKSSRDRPACPDCGSKSLEKKMSGFVARSAEPKAKECKHGGACGCESGGCCGHSHGGECHCHCH